MPIINDPERTMTVDTESGYFIRNMGGYARGLLEGFDFGQLQEDGSERILGGFSAAIASTERNGTFDPETGEKIQSFYYEIRVVGNPHELPKREITELAVPILEKHKRDHGKFSDAWQSENIATIDFKVGQYAPFMGKDC